MKSTNEKERMHKERTDGQPKKRNTDYLFIYFNLIFFFSEQKKRVISQK
jgi:uncharacterized pyridoxamine 5'-phosphate oxidase family protein